MDETLIFALGLMAGLLLGMALAMWLEDCGARR